MSISPRFLLGNKNSKILTTITTSFVDTQPFLYIKYFQGFNVYESWRFQIDCFTMQTSYQRINIHNGTVCSTTVMGNLFASTGSFSSGASFDIMVSICDDTATISARLPDSTFSLAVADFGNPLSHTSELIESVNQVYFDLGNNIVFFLRTIYGENPNCSTDPCLAQGGTYNQAALSAALGLAILATLLVIIFLIWFLVYTYSSYGYDRLYADRVYGGQVVNGQLL